MYLIFCKKYAHFLHTADYLCIHGTTVGLMYLIIKICNFNWRYSYYSSARNIRILSRHAHSNHVMLCTLAISSICQILTSTAGWLRASSACKMSDAWMGVKQGSMDWSCQTKGLSGDRIPVSTHQLGSSTSSNSSIWGAVLEINTFHAFWASELASLGTEEPQLLSQY